MGNMRNLEDRRLGSIQGNTLLPTAYFRNSLEYWFTQEMIAK